MMIVKWSWVITIRSVQGFKLYRTEYRTVQNGELILNIMDDFDFIVNIPIYLCETFLHSVGRCSRQLMA